MYRDDSRSRTNSPGLVYCVGCGIRVGVLEGREVVAPRPVPDDLGEAARTWQQAYSLVPISPTSEMQAAFGHLDGYGAAYYTYGWSRVIAADMFSRFKAEGLTNAETAAAMRETRSTATIISILFNLLKQH